MDGWQELGMKLVDVGKDAAKRAGKATLLTVVIYVDANGQPQQWIGPSWQRADDEQWALFSAAAELVETTEVVPEDVETGG